MDGAIKLGRLFGIPILIHFTFLLIIPLFAWVIGSDIQYTVELVRNTFHVQIDDQYIQSGYVPYILGETIAVGLFIGVLIHELAHSLIALRSGIRIDSITLLFFGGVAAIEEKEPEPKSELIMALAGPLTSLALGLGSALMVYVIPQVVQVPGIAGVLIYTFGYLAILNVLLFGFNLLPAFPMDGGRVLRAYLATRMPLYQATSIASSIGKGFAILFGLVGLILFSPILILIAFFIYIGAEQESAVSRYNFLLKDVTVGQIMSSPVVVVSPTTPLSDILALMYQTKHLGFPVVEQGYLVGIITLTDLAKTPVIDRDAMQVRDVMSRDVIVLPPHAPVMDALRIMTKENIGRIPVIADERITGIVTKSDIFTVIELREL